MGSRPSATSAEPPAPWTRRARTPPAVQAAGRGPVSVSRPRRRRRARDLRGRAGPRRQRVPGRYLAGVIVGNAEHPARQPVTRFFGALGWLAQIALFLMLGLLVTPHEPPPLILPTLAVSALLILVARPAGVMACLLPFRWRVSEAAFVSWAELRGAVPIYLTIVPLLAGVRSGQTLFNWASPPLTRARPPSTACWRRPGHRTWPMAWSWQACGSSPRAGP